MPVIFLFSAVISGTALLIVLYVLSCKLRKVPVDVDCVKGMGYTLWGFVMFTLLLEAKALKAACRLVPLKFSVRPDAPMPRPP